MEKYFSELKLDEQGGQERVCRVSGEKFYVRLEDIEFYKKIQVPLPTLSPSERMRLKMSFVNIENLFFNESAKTGKKIVSAYPPNTSYKIWEHKIWNDTDFIMAGIEYNEKQKFFEQYQELKLAVPRPNLFIKNGVNSDFTNLVLNVKNCFLIFDASEAEDCAYGEYLDQAKNCWDCFGAIHTNNSFDSLMEVDCYQTFFVENSERCLDSAFLFDCRDCSNCFMCTNLRHKKYCFYNEQLSKTEYENKMREINLGSIKVIEKYKKEFKEFKRKNINRANRNTKTINCVGDNLLNTKNCYQCFHTDDSQNLAYCLGVVESRDVWDCFISWANSELSYELSYSFGSVYQAKFSVLPSNLQNCEYCDFCKNCSDCFACIGLKNKQFCIFNKQYSEEEYWKKLDEIKTKMLADGEYGEFFPKELAPVPYNISVATSYGGYDDLDIAKKYGYRIEEVEEPNPDTQNEITIDEVPDDIKDVTDDILTKVIIDKKNNKKFKYTKEELEFHRKYNLALPTEHYSAILARKRIALGPIDFNPKYRNCTKCGEKTQVTFPEDHPDAPLRVYCEKCYNEEV
jgi:hypothetical protein